MVASAEAGVAVVLDHLAALAHGAERGGEFTGLRDGCALVS